MSNPGPASTTSTSNLLQPQIVTASKTLVFGSDNLCVDVVQAPAGLTITLPPAIGNGAVYNVQIGATVTSNSVVIQTGVTGALSDGFQGPIVQTGASGATTSFNPVTTAGSKSDKITLNGTTTGGIIGDNFTFTDIGAGVWMVDANTSITGTAATPYSHV